MKSKILLAATIVSSLFIAHSAFAFEGRIHAVIAQGGQTDALLYTVDTNFLRVEMTATNWPNPVDIVDRNSGTLTLLFPANRSFVRLKPATENSSPPPGFPQMPGNSGMPAMRPPVGLPPGIGPQSQAASAPGVSAMPAMPIMPPMMEKIELRDTGQKTNLLGFTCEQYEIKQRGETMEIWATDQLISFQPYLQNQPRHFGPRMMEEQWRDLLAAKKLFPVRAVLHYYNGIERFLFEITSVTPQKLTDEDAKLFQPPSGYLEIQPLPF
jgi:hypothetical protein